MKKEYDFKKAKRGAVVPQKGKTRITIFIDNDVLEEFRARADKAGYGYQTMINEALRHHLAKQEKPIDESVLRKVIREELQRTAHD
ncbi:MAG: BrnA antitoxin family protein [Deltaproteobacteria bacterium]|nr:BrnA antitoxin family protein [Deltaproteobacteria bacterium]